MRYLPLLLLVLGFAACGRPDGDETRPRVAAGPGFEGSRPATDTLNLPPIAELPMEVEPAAGAVPDGDTPVSSGPLQPGTSPGVAPAPIPPTLPLPGGPAADPPQAAPTDAVAILDRADRTYSALRSMEADFVQEVRVPLLETTIHSRGRLFHRAPDRFLMRFSDPQGDIILVDGRYGWMYYPSTDPVQVMRSPLGAGGQQVNLHQEFLSDATERFTVSSAGTENVGGRSAHALTLRPRGRSPYRQVRIWVDAQDFLVRRFEITEQNDSVRRVDLSNLRTNVSLADDLFRFTPPPGTQIVEF